MQENNIVDRQDFILLLYKSIQHEEFDSTLQPSNTTLDMLPNGGPMTSDHIYDVPDLGTRWYSPDALTNIISLADLSSKYHITYDLEEDKALYVHLPDQVVRFPELKNDVYALDPHKDNNVHKANKN
eukprot:9643001-Ditylum_brightwellii.AAC.1